MPNEFSRSLRVAEAIKRVLAPWIQRQAKEVGLGLVTITAVKVAPDLREAKIYISSLGAKSHQEIVVRLNQEKGVLRHYLSQHLRMRTVPELTILFDESVEQGARISALLATLSEDKAPGSRSEGESDC
jgi:ribosome-binding factor A